MPGMGKESRKQGYPRSESWLLVLGAVAIVVMVLVAYSPAMQGGFVWDDDDYVTENPLLTAPDGLKRIWFSLDSPSQYFPLVYTTFRVEHALWGLDPLGYHIVNVLLHAINVLLVWYVLRRLSVPGAWLAAAIFGLHPVHVESVAWITERKNVLSMLFFLLAILAYVRFIDRPAKSRNYYSLAVVLYALALFSKTTACVLPAALLLIHWLRGERIGRRQLALVAPFVVLGLAMGLLTVWWEKHRQGTSGEPFDFTMMERVLVASRALWFYAGKLLWPAKLTFSYPRWSIDAGDPRQYAWLVACLGVAAVLFWKRRSFGRGPSAAVVFFVAALVPMLGFFSLYTFRYTLVADHYQYVASIGPIALFAAFVARRWRPPSLAYGVHYALPVAVLAIFGVLTWRQGHIYANEETLWRDTAAKNPSSLLAHNNLAELLNQQGRIEEAIVEYYEAVRTEPEFVGARLNLALCLMKQGRFEAAFEQLDEARRILPQFPVTYYNLGVVMDAMGKCDEAITYYRKAVQLDPDYWEAHANLGIGLMEQGKFDEAISCFREVLRVEPGRAVMRNNLAAAFYNKGMYAEAWKEIHLCRRAGFDPHPDLVKVLSQKMPEPER